MRVGPLARSAVGDVMDLIEMIMVTLICCDAISVIDGFAVLAIYFVASPIGEAREHAGKHFARTAEAPNLKFVRLNTLIALGQFCVISVRYQQEQVASIVRNSIAKERVTATLRRGRSGGCAAFAKLSVVVNASKFRVNGLNAHCVKQMENTTSVKLYKHVTIVSIDPNTDFDLVKKLLFFVLGATKESGTYEESGTGGTK